MTEYFPQFGIYTDKHTKEYYLIWNQERENDFYRSFLIRHVKEESFSEDDQVKAIESLINKKERLFWLDFEDPYISVYTEPPRPLVNEKAFTANELSLLLVNAWLAQEQKEREALNTEKATIEAHLQRLS